MKRKGKDMEDKEMDLRSLKNLLIDEHIRLETMLKVVKSTQERTLNMIEGLHKELKKIKAK